MSLILKEHLEWIKKKVKGEEHSTFENFVAHFDLSYSLSATSAYTRLIAFPEIRLPRRQKLQASFSDFRKHRADRFWSKFKALVNSEVVANDALVSVQEFGQRQSKIILDRFTLTALDPLAEALGERSIASEPILSVNEGTADVSECIPADTNAQSGSAAIDLDASSSSMSVLKRSTSITQLNTFVN
ncbi:hypothetical protein BC939DRAFT_482584 [Gamsiella multidivaricata]|uniref:uncharacterized protein n=1 Tax=Gamsiella multidivaricata TaxID=101098 RepID=UPI00221EFC54|nr:uncharacterized protein BC939DRAFT_482584 [Gamsiella multidivaricata]KAI7815784.1 hypothetical protein BC939DRAFT_482584 [Gamsiella multidivaricata]